MACSPSDNWRGGEAGPVANLRIHSTDGVNRRVRESMAVILVKALGRKLVTDLDSEMIGAS